MKPQNNSSWENVHSWYDKTVGDKGHYFHRTIVIPGSLELLNITQDSNVLDLACGQGILEKSLPAGTRYTGVDASESLVEAAQRSAGSKEHIFITRDVTGDLGLNEKFTHITCILALQNINDIRKLMENAGKLSQTGTKFLLVINHPYFRIPRHSSWETDEKNNTVYRRSNRYMSTLEIPVLMNPGSQGKKEFTTSYHYPLAVISEELNKNGFCISKIEEWVSDKESVGKHAKAENTARREFPLFMAILATHL